MRKFIYKGELRMTPENFIDIQLIESYIVVFNFLTRYAFQPCNQFFRLQSFVSFYITDNYIPALFFTLMGGLKHGICLAYACNIAKEDFKFAALHLFRLGAFEQFVRVGAK